MSLGNMFRRMQINVIFNNTILKKTVLTLIESNTKKKNLPNKIL